MRPRLSRIGSRQFFQILLDQLLAVMHLLAHQLADLLALFAAQVQLAVRGIAATVLSAVTWTHWAVATRHGHCDGWQGSSKHQSN